MTAPTLSYAGRVAAAQDADPRVRVERDGAQATVTLDHPADLNALSAELTVQLRDAVDTLAADPEVRAVVLTGAGRGFSAGGDLALMEEFAWPAVDHGDDGAATPWRWIRQQFGGIARTIVSSSDTAFVAAINGPAAGVGLAFALACDVILASDRAQLVPAFGRIGLTPEVGTSWLLTRRLGYQRAFELYVSGRPLTGAEAAATGLVNACVPHDRLLPEAGAWCERILALSPAAQALGKTVLRQCADLGWEQAIAFEEAVEPICFTTTGHRDAVRAIRSRD